MPPLRSARRNLLALLAVASSLACAGPPARPAAPPPPPPPSDWPPAQRAAATELEALLLALPPAPEGTLRVQLAFSGEADLDLYVTDPLGEAVYYANTPSRSGGVLERDRRCTDPAPRLETVRFAAPAAGRYRVGVDYPHPCRGGRNAVPFVVLVETSAGRWTRAALARPLVFEPIVLEIDGP